MMSQKQIYMIMKKFYAGKIEFIGAYEDNAVAKRVAAENISDDVNFSISIHTITLHGSVMDAK